MTTAGYNIKLLLTKNIHRRYNLFVPTTKEEVKELNWQKLDIIIISGDAYIDSPSFGASVIGHVLLDKGYRVGIISQPDINGPEDIKRLGEPRLFWGVTSGSVDSMVSNFTSSGKLRKKDDLTPGGINNRRPDRALIAYSNLIRRYFKKTAPIVLGGIEASLRRIAHYDCISNSIRRSILFDSKADFLVYGMGERSVIDLADCMMHNNLPWDIRGLCFITKEKKPGYLELPSFENVSRDRSSFEEMFDIFYRNSDPLSAKGLCQKHGDRYLVQNPPAYCPEQQELDRIYNLPYERDLHPYYKKLGKVRALDTARFSITTHRGCCGGCSFCSIALHQGRRIISRSESSILKEVKEITKHPGFKGIINDAGGPTANMYKSGCKRMTSKGGCDDKGCLFPKKCRSLEPGHKEQVSLLRKMRSIPGVKKVFVASGIRYDLLLEDGDNGEEYLEELVKHHVSGQMKIAPEHTEDHVLNLMRKPGREYLRRFKGLFDRLNKKHKKKQYLTYYFIAAHPGCTMEHMKSLENFIRKELKMRPEQVQIFTPTPSTFSTLMYYTERDPFTGESIFVEKDTGKKNKQKRIITG